MLIVGFWEKGRFMIRTFLTVWYSIGHVLSEEENITGYRE
jgi:hypothetical protein